jgi:hypothetical protein
MVNQLKKSKFAIYSIVGLVLFMSLIFAFPVLAQTKDATPIQGGFVICGNVASEPCNVRHLFRAFVLIINYLITMAGFVAVGAIVYAGFQMVYSQGGPQLKEAKGRLSGAVIGLALVASAFVLINALFSGSFSVGLNNGTLILTNPSGYINQQDPNNTTPVPPVVPAPKTK